MTASKPVQASEAAINDAQGRPLLDVVRDIRTVLAPWIATLVRLAPRDQEADDSTRTAWTRGKSNAQEIARNRRLSAADADARDDDIERRAELSSKTFREWTSVGLLTELARHAEHLERAAARAGDDVPSIVRVVGERLAADLTRLRLDNAGKVGEREIRAEAADRVRAGQFSTCEETSVAPPQVSGTCESDSGDDGERWFRFGVSAAAVLDSEAGQAVGRLIDGEARLANPTGSGRTAASRPMGQQTGAVDAAIALLKRDRERLTEDASCSPKWKSIEQLAQTVKCSSSTLKESPPFKVEWETYGPYVRVARRDAADQAAMRAEEEPTQPDVP